MCSNIFRRSFSFPRGAARLVALLLPFWICLPGAPAQAAADVPPSALTSRINEIIDEGAAASAFWGIYVQEVASGKVLYSRNAERPFLPASNQKLLTAAAALDALGADHRFETTLAFDGSVDGATLRGDLILKGSGDPTFGSSEMPGRDPFDGWADTLAALGVTRIEGRLIGDDDAFDDRFYAEGWDVDYVTTQSSRLLGVSTGGLAYSDNLVKLVIESGRPGQAPKITTVPEGALHIRNRATTRARRRGRAIDIERTFGTETITVRGSVPTNYRATLLVPVTNPTMLALRSLKEELQEAGLDVSGLRLVDIDDLQEKPDFDEAEPFFVHLSPPLAQILPIVNKESNNFYADQLFRTFGYGGSANGSENRIKALLERAGASVEALSIRDGSGLSRKDLITPKTMVDLLVYMDRHPERATFLNSLPAGGEEETTLRYRLAGVPVRAKTGSLEFARALSGYATTADGTKVAFALFANNYNAPSYRITQTLDRIVRAITSAG